MSRAYGKEDKNLLHNYFFKGLLTLIIIFIVFSLMMLNSSSIL